MIHVKLKPQIRHSLKNTKQNPCHSNSIHMYTSALVFVLKLCANHWAFRPHEADIMRTWKLILKKRKKKKRISILHVDGDQRTKWKVSKRGQNKIAVRWDREGLGHIILSEKTSLFCLFCSSLVNPLTPNNKEQIILCCPHTFLIKAWGDVIKVSRNFTLGDHILNSHEIRG